MLTLTEEQRMFLRSVRDIAEREFAEKSCTWNGESPRENLTLLAEEGYLGVSFPEEYGGGGLTAFEGTLMRETVARVCPDTGYALPDLGPARTVAMFGTDAAKSRFIPPITRAEERMVIAISEPDAGSDVPSMVTTVTEEDGQLLLNGVKTWVSGFPGASSAVVWVKFPEGLGTVVIELDSPGIEVGNDFTNMFGNTQTQFYMDDVVVPEEYILTRGRDAFKEQLQSLNWERVGSAALCTGTAMCAFDKGLQYAKEREQFGQPIADFQGIEWKLADMAKKVQAARELTYSAAKTAYDEGRPPDRLRTSLANLYSAEILEEVISESLQIHGATGYQQGHPLEWMYRFGRGRRMASGTDEIQKNAIASVLKRGGLPHIV